MDSLDLANRGTSRGARRTRAAIAVTLVFVALAGAWFAWGRRPGESDESSSAVSNEAADAGPGGLLAAPGRSHREADAAEGAKGGAGSGAGPASRPRMKSPGPTWIVGEVVDEAGAPMPWARVGMYSVTKWQTRAKERTVLMGQGMLKADADGHFWRNSYVAGYELWLVVEDDRSFTSEPVMATAGGDPVRLVALRRKTARVRVEDAKGHALAGASITVRPILPTRVDEWTLAGLHASDWPTAVATGDRTELRTVTDATGLAVCPLPDARVRMALDVAPPIDRDDLLPAHLVPWTSADEATIRLAVGLPVAGRVVDARGRPWLEGVVRWTPDGGETADAKIAYDGTFELPPQPPGPIRLEIVDENLLRPKEPRPTVVAAGATGIVLVMDTASELEFRISNRAKGVGGKAYLSVDGNDGAQRGATIVDLENDGTAVMRGLLDDETYVLWVPSVELDTSAAAESGKEAVVERSGFVYRRGITVRDSPLVVEEVAGEPVVLEIDSHPPWYAESASIASRGVVCTSHCAFVGSYKYATNARYFTRHQAGFPPLPPGEWTVRIEGLDLAEDDPKPVSVDVTVKSGAKLHVDFGPPDEHPK